MTKPTIKLVNAETGEEVIREMNAQELAQLEIDQVNAAAKQEAEQEVAAEKAAVLDRLGISEAEAKLLLS